MDIFWGGLCHFVGGSEILLATPTPMYLMNLSAQKVNGGGHLLKSGGEVIQPLLLKVGLVGLITGPLLRSTSISCGSQVDSLGVEAQRLGNATPPLPLSHAAALTHYPCKPVGGHRLQLHGTPQPVLWPQWPRHHSGNLPVLGFKSSSLQ